MLNNPNPLRWAQEMIVLGMVLLVSCLVTKEITLMMFPEGIPDDFVETSVLRPLGLTLECDRMVCNGRMSDTCAPLFNKALQCFTPDINAGLREAHENRSKLGEVGNQTQQCFDRTMDEWAAARAITVRQFELAFLSDGFEEFVLCQHGRNHCMLKVRPRTCVNVVEMVQRKRKKVKEKKRAVVTAGFRTSIMDSSTMAWFSSAIGDSNLALLSVSTLLAAAVVARRRRGGSAGRPAERLGAAVEGLTVELRDAASGPGNPPGLMEVA